MNVRAERPVNTTKMKIIEKKIGFIRDFYVSLPPLRWMTIMSDGITLNYKRHEKNGTTRKGLMP